MVNVKKTIAIIALIFSIIAVIVAISSLLIVLCHRNPMESSKEWKISHVTPNAPLVKEAAEFLGSPEAIRNFIESKYVYVWEELDTWAYPQEMLESYHIIGRLEGDCEDVALLEVSLLRAIGIPEDQVRVVIFSYPAGEIQGIHAGVEVWRNGDWRLLRLYDPRGFWTEQILYPEEERMFAFNDKMWWNG